MNLRFEPAASIDIEPLFELNQSLIEQYEDLASVRLDRILPWVKRKLEDKLPEYRAIFLDNQKVGYFRLFEVDDATLELDDLYILAPYQGMGIGSLTVRHCIEESERLQKALMLYVFTKNTRAVSLYEKMGFVLKESISPTRNILIRRA